MFIKILNMKRVIAIVLILVSCKDNRQEVLQTQLQIDINEKNIVAAERWIWMSKRDSDRIGISKGMADSTFFKHKLDSLHKRLKELSD